MPGPARTIRGTQRRGLLTEDELRALPTRRLLAYQSVIRKAVEGPSFNHSDTDPRYRYPQGNPRFSKKSPEYIELRRVIREILATREHVPRRS